MKVRCSQPWWDATRASERRAVRCLLLAPANSLPPSEVRSRSPLRAGGRNPAGRHGEERACKLEPEWVTRSVSWLICRFRNSNINLRRRWQSHLTRERHRTPTVPNDARHQPNLYRGQPAAATGSRSGFRRCPKPCFACYIAAIRRVLATSPRRPGMIVRADVGTELQTRCRPGFGLSPEPTTVTTQY